MKLLRHFTNEQDIPIWIQNKHWEREYGKYNEVFKSESICLNHAVKHLKEIGREDYIEKIIAGVV